jgi:hypothetical protein
MNDPIDRLLEHAPRRPPGSVDRVRRRLEFLDEELPAPRPQWPLQLALVAAGVAVGVGIGRWDTTPRAEAAAVMASDIVTHEALRDGVMAHYTGEGSFRRDGDDLDVTWSDGTLELEVAPGAGLDVEVRTDEALVQVVGTVFEVRRDVTGTHVQVSRGRVEVRCTGASQQVLSAGEEASCLPTTVAGLVNRATALAEAGNWQAVRATASLGLERVWPDNPLRDELLYRLAESAYQLGEHAAARDAAERYLESASLEARPTIADILLWSTWAVEGCDGVGSLQARGIDVSKAEAQCSP